MADKLLARPEFPRAGQYDVGWVIENQMGEYTPGRLFARRVETMAAVEEGPVGSRRRQPRIGERYPGVGSRSRAVHGIHPPGCRAESLMPDQCYCTVQRGERQS